MAAGADDFIRGINAFTEQIGEVHQFMEALAATKFDVHCDPNNPASVDRAAREIERNVDAVAARFPNNPTIAQIARQATEEQVQQLREFARRRRYLS